MLWQHLLTAFDASARLNAGQPAVICGNHVLSYQALDERSNQFARHLIAKGVNRNDVVAVLLPRSVELIVAILGIMKAGGAYMPLDLHNPVARNEIIARNANVRAVISQSSFRKAIPEAVDRCLLDDDAYEIAASHTDPIERAHHGDDLAYVINTSGSTGEPKSAAIYHRGFANLLQWYRDALSITAHDAVLIIGAPTFDATQKNLFVPLLSGGRLIFPEGDLFDPEQLADLVYNHKVTWVNGTPSNFYPIAEGPGTRFPNPIASLRWVVLGGETIHPHRLIQWLRHPDCTARVLNTYGPTECTDICAAWAFDGGTAQAPVPIGRPIDNVRIAILNEHGVRVGPGIEGELWIGGAGIGAGYLGRDDLNEKCFVESALFGTTERVYRTGDRVRWRDDGAIEFLGRIDTQVKLRGLRVELGEIEAALGALPEVREAVVLLRTDVGNEACLVAYLLPHPDAEKPSAPRLRQALAAKLPDYFIPSIFVWRDRFPYSANGKVNRRALPPPPVEEEAAPVAPASAAGGSMETMLADIWRKVLRRQSVAMDENFFDAGGSSLGLVEIQAELARRLDRKIPVVLLFANPTIRSAAAALSTASTASDRCGDQGPDRASMRRQSLDRAKARRKAR